MARRAPTSITRPEHVERCILLRGEGNKTEYVQFSPDTRGEKYREGTKHHGNDSKRKKDSWGQIGSLFIVARLLSLSFPWRVMETIPVPGSQGGLENRVITRVCLLRRLRTCSCRDVRGRHGVQKAAGNLDFCVPWLWQTFLKQQANRFDPVSVPVCRADRQKDPSQKRGLFSGVLWHFQTQVTTRLWLLLWSQGLLSLITPLRGLVSFLSEICCRPRTRSLHSRRNCFTLLFISFIFLNLAIRFIS